MGFALALSGCAREPAQPSDPRSLPGVATKLNQLSITAEDRILWNGSPVSEAQLSALLKQSRVLPAEPELEFRPDAGASYDVSARVLQIVKESGVTKFGFIGNEMFVTPDKPK